MKRAVKRDPFFDRQPEMKFIDELRSPVHSAPPANFARAQARPGEADVRGMYIKERFPDDGGLLDVSYADIDTFIGLCGMGGGAYPLYLRRGETECFEAYEIDISPERTVVTAADTEGVRRALIYIEDELRRREGPFLPLGRISRKPALKSRITRCFFSPINRPPKYGDELSDDIDYYPDEYLNRLMHDGANGVWIYSRFSDLVTSRFLSDYGKGRAPRIAKLNRVIEKCARYGVKVYVFAIEPVALTPEQSARFPEVDGGAAYNGNRLFCVNTKAGREFVAECGRQLFESCPGLGGFISITYGERPTSCASARESILQIGHSRAISCPRCRDIAPGQALANAAAALAAGIHEAKPDAEVISWSYGHRFWDHAEVQDYVRRAPDDVVLMQNFEEMGYAGQLGKPRQGVDYWLSYPGPSPLFDATAAQAQASGKRMYMKTQVCCSHEVATVPYVPVPGLIFDKYRAARGLGVEGVMQCWYFGNYPSMMSKAAGELAFEHDFTDKRAFLERLAGIYWGESRAAQAADAWEEFERGYREYPLNIMFSYYGPMHDGPVWELQLKPKNFSLPRSWQTLDPTDGDRIAECLLDGHTLDEALTLCRRMSESWRRGVEKLEKACAADDEQLSVARALDILFASGTDILEFYRLRHALGTGRGNASDILGSMLAIVRAERRRSLELIPMCENDGRLGYHSEGEGYKYFPEKLRHRIAALDRLIETEFVEVRARIEKGLTPLAYYAGEEPDCAVYHMSKTGIEDAPWEKAGESCAFRAAYDARTLTLELKSERREAFTLNAEFELMDPAPPVTIRPDGRVEVEPETYLYYAVFGDKVDRLKRLWNARSCGGEGTHITVTIDRISCGWTEDRPLRLRVASENGDMWQREEEPVHTLGKSTVSPLEFGWLMP